MAAIGAWIIAIKSAVAGSGTIFARMYGPVKWVGDYVAISMSCPPSRKSTLNAYCGKNGAIGY